MSPGASSPEAEIVDWLTPRADRAMETACARIFLAGEVAWKLKRHRDLGYADFSTLERRHWALDRELEFNRPTAPDIYRRVRAVTRDAAGRLAFDGEGEVVDYALEMRRFDDSGVLSANPAALTGVTGPRTRTCRRSDFQWNRSAALGLAASSRPLALSTLE